MEKKEKMCVSMYVWVNQADTGLLCGSGVTPYQPCVHVCSSTFPSPLEQNWHYVIWPISHIATHFSSATTVGHLVRGRKLALRRKDSPEVKVEVRCRFWWLRVLITVINQLIYTAWPNLVHQACNINPTYISLLLGSLLEYSASSTWCHKVWMLNTY